MNRLLVCLLLACASTAVKAQKKAIDLDKVEIAATNADFIKAFNEDNITKIPSFYTPGAILMPPNSSKYNGRAAVKEYYRANFPLLSDFTSSTSNITVIEGKTAYEDGSYVLTIMLPGATDPMVDRGKYLYVWQKGEDGRWRLQYNMFNSDLAPAK